MTGSAPAMTRPYLFVEPGGRGALSLTSPSGETVVLVCSVVDGAPSVMIATLDGQRVESVGWKLAALRSSGPPQISTSKRSVP